MNNAKIILNLFNGEMSGKSIDMVKNRRKTN